MAADWIHFLLFFNFALCVLSARPVEEEAEQILPTVQIINSLPPHSPPLSVSCSSKNIKLGARSFSVGETYEFKVKGKDDVYSCAAQWQRYFESWQGFERPRDENHGAVYWLVKKDGFYRSWDKASWVLEDPWETE